MIGVKIDFESAVMGFISDLLFENDKSEATEKNRNKEQKNLMRR